MKYVIKHQKLPFSEEHHDFTLIIHLGKVTSEAGSYEAKLQFPTESYREGLALYRQFVNDQKDYLGNSQISHRTTSTSSSSSQQQQAIAYSGSQSR
ncbi:MAG: hypothetical protein VKL39_21345 [Leptolyngbyaceae bacterium]|nr:hypothetical protein [Leptolyngbyaceae bacterium]